MIIDRKIFFTLLASVTLSGMIVICTLAQNIYNEKISSKVLSEPVPLESVGYVLREYNGNLGIFRGESESPYKIVTVNLNLLSDFDREALRIGIEMDSESEINRLIEDLTS